MAGVFTECNCIDTASGTKSYDYFQNHGLVSKTAGSGTSSIAASVGVLGGAYTGAEGTTIE